MATNIREEKLDHWIKNNLNVLFVGKHGVGKTAMVKDAFERNKLKWRYFSASTMDPWVDFIGVPREASSEINGKMVSHLELVRPIDFATDDVEALFFDEFNRSPKKIRNAVMELIQFKSINGKKFNNLKLVWAAINPDDDDDNTYDVEKLDPAQQDRFHITIEIPYEPNGAWFKEAFGDQTAKTAIQWWNELPEEEKNKISPRRLEYALRVKQLKGDMRDVLPVTANVSKLMNALNTGPITDKLEALMRSKDVTAARSFLSNENNYAAAMKYIEQSETMMTFFLPVLPKEKLSSLMADKETCCKHIISNMDTVPLFSEVCRNIVDAGANKRLIQKIRRAATESQNVSAAYVSGKATQADPPYHAKRGATAPAYSATLTNVKAMKTGTAEQAIAIFEKIEESVPKEMTADEALATLELLGGSVSKLWPSTLTTATFGNLMGVVNHCIGEIHRHTGLDWTGILNKHGTRFKSLLEKIKETGLDGKLYTPSSK